MSYQFFQNRECEYFPCHKGVMDEDFNCLFCFCPLYTLAHCPGTPAYIDAGGARIKDCSGCLVPHKPGGYDRILDRFRDVAELAKRKDG